VLRLAGATALLDNSQLLLSVQSKDPLDRMAFVILWSAALGEYG
jgi:hypothetical protein